MLNETDKRYCLEILHQYIDLVSEKGFFGQMIISWEKGRPVMVKEHATLNIDDIARLCVAKD